MKGPRSERVLESDADGYMSHRGRKILEDALALPAEERADLAATLIDSLDEKDAEAVDEAWAEEIQRRVREVESGAVTTVSWSEARRRMLTLRDARTRP
jgi:putative addiction module component (TIGR02574 family)